MPAGPCPACFPPWSQHSHCRSRCRRRALWQGTPPSPPGRGTCNGPRSELTGQSQESDLSGYTVCPAQGLWLSQRTVLRPQRPSLRELWTASTGVGMELGAREGEGEHVEQINVSLGHKATRVMTRWMPTV